MQQDEAPQDQLETPEGKEWQRLLHSISGKNLEQTSSWKTSIHKWAVLRYYFLTEKKGPPKLKKKHHNPSIYIE